MDGSCSRRDNHTGCPDIAPLCYFYRAQEISNVSVVENNGQMKTGILKAHLEDLLGLLEAETVLYGDGQPWGCRRVNPSPFNLGLTVACGEKMEASSDRLLAMRSKYDPDI